MRKLIAGSRGSALAMVQTEWVVNNLDCDSEIKKITTRGDKITDVALAKIEGKGFFTREIDEALLKGEIDFAVHSFKDLPTDLPEGIAIAAVPARESPRDVLVGPYESFSDLPEKSKVGTSSLRRQAQARMLRSDADIIDLRGNIDTRLRKLSEGQYDTIIVAEAGLKRMGFSDYHPLDPEQFIPAACQGAIVVTTRSDDAEAAEIVAKLDHKQTRTATLAEREFLIELQGGCQIPAGIYSRFDENAETITAFAFISSLDGKRYIKHQVSGPTNDSSEVTKRLAHKLLESGGAEIIEEIRKEGS